MLKNILIDPYMFELSDEQEIKENIRFFQEIIRLCESNRINVYLYQTLYDRIKSGSTRLFPVDVSELRDPFLKRQVLIVNGNFLHAILNTIRPIDIGDCFDIANVTSGYAEIDEDALYYELLSILISPCYMANFILEDKVLTGVKANGKSIGSKFYVRCNCKNKEFNRDYLFTSIDQFISAKDKAFYNLQEAAKNKIITFIENPQVTRGDHHNHLQAKDFNRFDQLSRKNRGVLNLLRFFGMKRIIFEDFHPDQGKIIGSIKVNKVVQADSQDIVYADFFAETGFRYGVRIFFPNDVGQDLFTYLDGNFNYQNIEKLKSLLGLMKQEY